VSRRFLITLWPFTGHLLPQLSIALALRERGHEVAFYSGEEVRETVEGLGFELFAFERVDADLGFRTMREVDNGDRRKRPGGGRLVRMMRDWLVETIPAQLADLRPLLAQWRPDAIATDLSMWAPIVVLWESEPIPVALSSTFMGPLIPGPDAPAFGFGLRPPSTPLARAGTRLLTALTELGGRPMRRRVDEIRAESGLPSLGASVNRFTARLPLYVVGNVPALDYDRHDLPPSVYYLGNYAVYPEGEDDTDAWLDQIPAGRPWVHVTESTLAFGEPFLLKTAIAALAGQPVELVLTTGSHRDPATLGLDTSGPNVHVARWLRHGALLPRCSAIVTVGGKATVLAAAEAGVPLVVVPTTWDKPDNARRVTDAGIGVSVRARRCTPELLRGAVFEVLYDARYRAAAERIARQIAAAPGAAGAAALLEELGSQRVSTPTTVGGGGA
jgi:UDP:flavonoid glycosyltransferase YjiC (YdhE family)